MNSLTIDPVQSPNMRLKTPVVEALANQEYEREVLLHRRVAGAGVHPAGRAGGVGPEQRPAEPLVGQRGPQGGLVPEHRVHGGDRAWLRGPGM